jgi:hypothetical protein
MPRGWTLEAGGSLQESARLRVRGEDRGQGAADAPDVGILSVAIELADQALRGLSLPRVAYAGLLSELYEGVRMRMPYRELLGFARTTALRAQHEAASPDVDDGTRQAASTELPGRRATG